MTDEDKLNLKMLLEDLRIVNEENEEILEELAEIRERLRIIETQFSGIYPSSSTAD